MNGDLTRSTFDPSDEFTSVRAQQGRVMLDVDHNEQVDIQLHDTRSGRMDLVGGSGAPTDAAGFGVTLSGGQPVLGVGRYLVDGIRVANSAQVNLAQPQPFLPVSSLPSTEGAWLAYLEVWERPLTAVEEPSIREVALGGPDTTLREQRVWQVRWLRVGNGGTGDCSTAATALQNLGLTYDGTLQPRLAPSAASGPCIVSEASDFRGLENQLYRVEVHAGNIGPDGAPTGLAPSIKWSRDNGAIIASAVGLVTSSPLVLQVDRLGPGGAAGFEIGGTIEVKGEAEVLTGVPGILARIDDVQADTLRLTLLGSTLAQLQATLAGKRVVVRRWDSVGAVGIVNNTFLPLGTDGLQVRFDTTKRYRTGDFWLIPARTAALPGTGKQLDWPLANGSPTDFETRPAQGVVRHRVPLALLDRTGAGGWAVRSDCRKLFPPLTTLWTLTSAGGDGQHGRGEEWLPAPLAVVVTHGSAPIAGARVRFRVTSGGGQISAAAPAAPAPAGQIDVTTDASGIARVYMRLGAGPSKGLASAVWEPALAQTVEAVRLGPNNAPIGAPISFVAQTANQLNLHIVGGNGQQGRPGETLEVALRVRIDDGIRPIENAVVEFTVLNRIFNGQGLNEDQGGSVHASARFVSGEKWTNGVRYHTVRTSTDSEGVAQVQWILGTLLDLTTQRIEARLVDRAGNATTVQTGLFLAQLALASEVVWQPNVAWLATVLQGPNRNAQEAIDELARRINVLQQESGHLNPFTGLQWRNTSNAYAALGPNTKVPSTSLAAIVFRDDLVPPGRNTGATTPHGGIRVYVELPYASHADVPLVLNLGGTVAKGTQGWEWRMSSAARSSISKYYNALIPVRVTVVPRWLPGGIDTDSTQVHEFSFEFVTPILG
ncbi:Pectine lyase [Myxococcus stipitatus DSM 14675]|uniref:Pectine lyase n=1 Tax=Myxococcus stipitatus (strain DSM 14675 / JCM 12634 / Mx s8) TaxID=1278073 RepID=L7UGT1_MYXSD|nr:DUF6519 domain-containing protein [Myxococcus stipitatus]AGC48181.1 Pectine lyase [Myxococcus stipitatus DSM 14675]